MKQSKASDEAIIFSDGGLVINNETIVVKEITYKQGILVHSKIKPMIDDMAKALNVDDLGFSAIADVFAEHAAIVDFLMLLTTGKDADWLEQLGDGDGQALMMEFWTVNADFFTRRLVLRSMQAMQKKPLNQQTQSPSTTALSSVN